jgi:hypothetical protein
VLATPPDLACPLPAEYPSLALLRQHGWLPVPRERLPFPSIVAVSSDDALGDPIRVRVLAGAWGSDLRDIGPVGHLNPASGYGEWTPAEALIKELDTSTMEIVNLAELLEREGRLADAQAQWREAAAAGDPRARSRLATLLRRGAPAEDPHATQ